MQNKQIVELHSPWNCRWSRIEHASSRKPGRPQARRVWNCIRPGAEPRHVTDVECLECPFWQFAPDKRNEQLFLHEWES